MSDMFGDFDPLLELQMLQHNVEEQRRTVNRLVRHANEQSKLLQDMSEQFVTLSQQNTELYRVLGEIMNNEVK